MRAGAPDSLDRMAANSFASVAIRQLELGHSGIMASLQNGAYTVVPVDTCVRGQKRVDVASLYDPDDYRPRIRDPLGKPMFMY